MDRQRTRIFRGLAAIVLLALTGCRTFEIPTVKLPFNREQEDSKPDLTDVLPPDKMVALWSNTVYNTPGKPATRGMAARIYFYDSKRNTVPVEGSLVVYGYDDSTGQKQEPDRKYIFTAEQLANHYSVSEFGPSYSIWIPWDQVGQPQTDVSLLPVFKGKDGATVMGEHTQHVLPGPSPNKTSRPQSLGAHREIQGTTHHHQRMNTNGLRLATYNSNDPQTNGSPSRYAVQADHLRSTSIKLPPAVRDRLIHSTSVLPMGPSVSRQPAGLNGEPAGTQPSMGTMPPVSTATALHLPTTESVGGPTHPAQPVYSPPPAVRSSVLDRIHAKTNSQRRLPSARYAPATPQVPTLPAGQPGPSRPAMPPTP